MEENEHIYITFFQVRFSPRVVIETMYFEKKELKQRVRTNERISSLAMHTFEYRHMYGLFLSSSVIIYPTKLFKQNEEACDRCISISLMCINRNNQERERERKK